MSELPEGWTAVALGDISEVKGGKRLPKGAEFADEVTNHPYIRVSDFRDRTVSFDNIQYLSEDVYQHISNYTIGSKDIYISIAGTIGVIGTIPEELDGANLTENAAKITNINSLDKRFLLHFLNSGAAQTYFHDQTVSTSQPKLALFRIKTLEIPLPPLAEQKRIADKLDVLLARVDGCRARLARVPVILKRFRQAVLAAATSGQLTADWREENFIHKEVVQAELQVRLKQWKDETPATKRFKEPVLPDLSYWSLDIPDSWETVSVSSFAKCLDHLRIPVKRDERKSAKGLYPYYGANGLVDMVDEYIFDDELVLVTEDETFYGREKPIAYRVSGRCWVNNHAHVLHPGDWISADYLCYCLMYYNVLPWLTGTTGRAKLTQADLNSLPIAIPPKLEMQEIVRRVEILFGYADRLAARYAAAAAQVERLTPALLAKAFRGELVAQDPADEPAAVLLARLRGATG